MGLRSSIRYISSRKFSRTKKNVGAKSPTAERALSAAVRAVAESLESRIMMSGSENVTIGSAGHPLTSNANYLVTVSNLVGNQESDKTSAWVTTPNPQAVPGSPYLYGAAAGGGQVILYWSPVAGATDYTVNWATNAGSGSFQTGNVSSYTFVPSDPTVEYWFRVTASNANGSSAHPSNQRHALPQNSPNSTQLTNGGFEGSYTWSENGAFWDWGGWKWYNISNVVQSGSGYINPTVVYPTEGQHMAVLDAGAYDTYQWDENDNDIYAYQGASVTQTLDLQPGTYDLTYDLNSPDGQTLSAGIDGLTPTNPSFGPGSSGWNSYGLQYSVTSAGAYTIDFSLPENDDGTLNRYRAFIDNVALKSVTGNTDAIPALASAARSDQIVHLTWNSVANATGYKLYFGTAPGVYDECLDLDLTTSYDFHVLDSSAQYYFAVGSYSGPIDNRVYSRVSNELTAVSSASVTSPTIYSVTSTNSSASVNFTNINAATGFKIYWGTSTSSYSNSVTFPVFNSQSVGVTAGTAFTAALGHISNAFVGNIANYTPTVQWADGELSSGNFVPDGNGGWWLVGSHNYRSSSISSPTVTLSDANGDQAQFAADISISMTALPTGWSAASVGPVALGAGQLQTPAQYGWPSASAGTYTIMAGGTGIGALSDQFNFSQENYFGDGTLLAQLTPDQSHASAATGIMLRDSLDPSAAFASISLIAGHLQFQSRNTHGLTQSIVSGASFTTPVWVRLIRSTGSNITAYFETSTSSGASSTSSWQTLGSISSTTLATFGLGGVFAASGSQSAQVLETIRDTSLGKAVIANSGFDDPAAGNLNVADPTAVGWSFSGDAGITDGASPFGLYNWAFNGQAAYVQNHGAISQSVYFTAGTYALSFTATSGSTASAADDFQVFVDNVPYGSYRMGAPAWWVTATQPWQSRPFTVGAGFHNIQIKDIRTVTGGRSVIDDVRVVAPTSPISVVNSGFENGTTGWTFQSNSGVNSGTAPEGSHFATLGATDSITSQSITGWLGGTYTISLEDAQNPGNSAGQQQSFNVLIDGINVQTITPSSIAWGEETTAPFTLSAGAHTIAFKGLGTHTSPINSAFLDDIRINVSPSGTAQQSTTPTNLIVTGSKATGTPEILLQWQDAKQDATAFVIDRATDSRFTQNLTSFYVAGDTRNFTDSTVTANQTYFYRIRASIGTPVLDGGPPIDQFNQNTGFSYDSAGSAQISAAAVNATVNLVAYNLQANDFPPVDPAHTDYRGVLNYYGTVARFTAGPDATAGDYYATVNWGSSGAQTVSSNPFVETDPVRITSDGAGGWIIKAIADGPNPGTYTYTVTLYNASHVPVASSTATAVFTTVDNSHTELTATATTGGAINLRWTDMSGNTYPALTYELDRSTDGTTFFAITTSLTSSQYTWPGYRYGTATLDVDNSVTAGQTYYYRVRGTSGGFTGAYSPIASATVALGGSYASQPIQTLTVPLDNSTIQTVSLASGVHYKLTASGSFQISTDATPYADADYQFDGSNNYGHVNSTSSGINYGVAINDPLMDQNKPVYWGVYNGSHTYSVDIVGTGKPLSITYHDDDPRNNITIGSYSGIQLTIYQQSSITSLTGLDQPPIFTSRPATDVTLPGTYRYQATAVDPDNIGTLTYSISSSAINNTSHPNNAISIDTHSGLITWQPTADEAGATYPVTLTVTDVAQNAAIQQFDISVDATKDNAPPDIISKPVAYYRPAGSYILPVTIRQFKVGNGDFGNDAENVNGTQATTGLLTQSLGGDGTPVFRSSTGFFAPGVEIQSAQSFDGWYHDTVGKYASVQKGQFNLKMNNDGSGNYSFVDDNFDPFNDAVGLQTLEMHSQFTYAAGEKITYRSDDDLWIFIDGQLVTDNGGIHQAGNTSEYDLPIGTTAGTHSLDLFYAERDTVGAGPGHLPNAVLELTTNFVMNPAVAQGPPLQNYSYTVRAVDPDKDAITYGFAPGFTPPSGMSIDSSTGVLTWNGPAVPLTGSQSISFDVTVSASDARGGYTTQTYTLHVLGPSAPGFTPLISSNPPTLAHPQKLYSYQVLVSNSGADRYLPSASEPLTYSIHTPSGGPVTNGMSISTHGLLTWTPQASDDFTSPTVLVEVDDLGALPAHQTVSLTVSSTAVSAPVISDPANGAALSATVNSRFDRFVQVANTYGGALSFQLPQHPNGMGVDPNTGEIFWIPTADEVGSQSAIVRVSDEEGNSAISAFSITVAPQTAAATISSTAPPAFLNQSWTYQVMMSSYSDTFTYSLLTKPPGMTISGSGLVSNWTPSTTGTYSFVIAVADVQRHITSTQDVVVNVVDPSADSGPVIDSVPSAVVRLGQKYFARIQAHDPLGLPLTYSLGPNSGNSGLLSQLQFDSNTGTISTTSPVLVSGTVSLTANVTNSYSQVAHRNFTVSFVSWAASVPPRINSSPLQFATVGHSYTYQPSLSDTSDGPYSWSVLKPIQGSTSNVATGAISWTPTANELGTQSIALHVIGADGSAETQTFAVLVRGANLPPMIVSEPPTQASTLSQYNYQVMAIDPQNYPLIYGLSSPPAGMSIDSVTGLLTWKPTTAHAAQYITVTVGNGQVDNSGMLIQSTQTFQVTTVAGAVDVPPQFTTLPYIFGTVGQQYVYQANALPALAGGSIQYALKTNPAGMTIDPSTGLISFAAPALDPTNPTATYEYPVAITATDQLGAVATQVYTLTVGANHIPRFVTTSLAGGVQGVAYAATISASDADNDPLFYSLQSVSNGGGSQDPSQLGMTFNSQTGAISWNNPVAGSYSLQVSVTDGRSTPVQETLTLTIAASVSGPTVSIWLRDGGTPVVNSTARIQVIAATNGNLTVAALTLAVTDYLNNTTYVPLDNNGNGVFKFTFTNTYSLNASVTDSAGNTVNSSTMHVTPVTTPASPTVSLSPVPPLLTTNVATITGSLTYAGNASFALTATPFNNVTGLSTGTAITLTNSATISGSTPISYSMDPKLFASGEYLLTLSETPNGGSPIYATAMVDVESQVKLGNFSLSFTDVSLTANGIPITIARTYDSLNANMVGDFGNGWTLSYQTAKLRVTNLASNGDGGYSQVSEFGSNTDVWITLPGQKPEEFLFYPAQEIFQNPFQAWFTPNYSTPAFVAVGAKNQDSLSVVDPTEDTISIEPSQDINNGYVDTNGNPYDPALFSEQYVLTTKSGLTYTIDAASGAILSETDANGNTVGFSATSISSNGASLVTINRDAGTNDITSIIYPSSSGTGFTTVSYSYSGGDLVGFTNSATGATAPYNYVYGDATRPHFLTAISQNKASGTGTNTLLQVSYVTGGGINLTNGNGQVSSLASTITASYNDGSVQSQQTATDPLGYGTITVVDQNDNVVRVIKQINGLPNVVGSSSVSCQVVISEYDSNNNLIAQSLPFVVPGDQAQTAQPTGYTYIPGTGALPNNPNVLDPSIVPADWSMVATYDPNTGNMTGSTDQTGQTTTYTYNNFGQVLTSVNSSGISAQNTYDPNTGNLLTSTDALGNTTTNTYDTSGHLKQSFNANGQVIATYQYTNGNLTSSTDGQGVVHNYSYDTQNNMNGTSFIWVNPLNAAVQVTVGTSSIFDGQGRVTSSTDQFGNVSSTNYNALGTVESTTNAFVGVTQYLYDPNGNLIQTRNCDQNGAVVTESETVYDAVNRPIYTDDLHVDGTVSDGTQTIYDGLGRVMETDRFKNLKISINNGTSWMDPSSVPTGLSYSSNSFNTDGTTAKSLAGTLSGAPGSTTHSQLTETDYYYDHSGRQTTMTLVNVTNSYGVSSPSTYYTYDAKGRRNSTIDAMGHTNSYQFDDDGRVTRTIFPDGTSISDQYDALGNKISQTDQNGNTTGYKYDVAGHLIEVDGPAVPNGSVLRSNGQPTMQSPITTYGYDQYGNEVIQVDANEYAALAAWVSMHPNSPISGFSGPATRFTYDALGHETSRTLPDGEQETFTFIASGPTAGMELTHTDFKGQTEAFQYDTTSAHGGRLLGEYFFNAGATVFSGPAINTGAASQSSVYTYDALGRVSTITDDSGVTVNHYDVEGNLTEVDAPEGTINYGYNPLNQHTSTYTSATKISYGYDNWGRMSTVSVGKLNGSTLGTSLITSYFYDKDGNKIKETLPNGAYTTNTYDTLNRLTDMKTVNSSGTTLLDDTYTLNPDGSRASVSETQLQTNNSTVATTTTAWFYDAQDKLLSESFSSGADPFGVGYQARTENYTYDLAANRLTHVHSDTEVTPYSNTSGNNTYTYELSATVVTTTNNSLNADDQLTSSNEQTVYTSNYYGIDPPGGSNDTTFRGTNFTTTSTSPSTVTTDSYDANGSLTQSISTTSGASTTNAYSYDLRNRMVSYTASGATTYYLYDDAGNRVEENEGGNPANGAQYLIDANNPSGYPKPIEQAIFVVNGSNVTGPILPTAGYGPSLTYIVGDGVIAQVMGGTISYLIGDGVGSTRALVSSSGMVTATYNFDGFKNAVNFNAASAGTVWLQDDAMFDGVSGLSFHGDGRQSNNATGRWMTADDQQYTTSASPLSGNLYLLDGANPTNMGDPTGHEFVSTVSAMAISGAISGALFGGAMGWATSYAQHLSLSATLLNIAEGALAGGVLGGVGGAAFGALSYGATLLGVAAGMAPGVATSFGLGFTAAHFSIAGIGLSAYQYSQAKQSGNEVGQVMALEGIGLSGVGFALSQGQLANSLVQSIRLWSWGSTPVNPELDLAAGNRFTEAFNKLSKTQRSKHGAWGYAYDTTNPQAVIPLVSSSGEHPAWSTAVLQLIEALGGDGATIPGTNHTVGDCVELQATDQMVKQFGSSINNIKVVVFDRAEQVKPPCPSCQYLGGN